MVDTTKYKVIFWDFDGVIMASNEIRNLGFENVLCEFPNKQVEKLLDFHKKNGGLSRYVKFRYFFEQIRGEHITDDEVNKWAQKFSDIMLTLLINPKLLINEIIEFIKLHHKDFIMHIASGSDEKELRYICKYLNIDKYFLSINGSPTPKKMLVANVLAKYKYNTDDCILIGDSINDFEAATFNNIGFKAYNNVNIEYLNTAL
jgi:phosphoglycolate phosphatase-like HAD superfamily hydrolase